MSGIKKDQRVAVFVDVQNMYYSAKNLYDAKINFANLLKKAVMGRKLIRAIAYVIRADIPEEENFFEALNKIGFEVKAKDLKVYFTGTKKGDWDMGIAIDAISIANKVDVVILITGDGDFEALVDHLKAMGVRVEVMAFGRSAARELKDKADYFFDMDGKKELLLSE